MKTKILTKGLFWALLALFTSAAVVSCKQKDDAKPKADSTAPAPQHELATEEGPGQDEERPALVDTVQWNGAAYIVSVHRAPTQDVPAVKDSWGDPYLDNAVDVVVKRDGETVASHKFLKTDFAAAASGIDLSSQILHDLYFDKSEAGGYILLAGRINAPGDIEACTYFNVKMSLGDGSFSISRDNSEVNFKTGEVLD